MNRGARLEETIAAMAEFDLIEIIKQRCVLTRADVQLGIGDDAAVVSVPADQDLVVCTDTLVAGVHFPLDTDPADIGWKSLAVSLSDLAAMGAQPAWATLALTLPSADAEFVTRFADGFAELAAEHAIDLIGGDTTRGPLTITVTAHGLVPTGCALPRAGAQVGDAVFVTGTLGDAAAGLRCLQDQSAESRNTTSRFQSQSTSSGRKPESNDSAYEMADTLEVDSRDADDVLIARLNRPQPRVAAGIALRGLATACIDISDGLLADLAHIAKASGVGFEIGEDCLPATTALFDRFDAESCGQFQLSGGDDYELAFTLAEADVKAMRDAMTRAQCRVTRIGRVIGDSGVHVLDQNGARRDTPARGWEHFK